MRSEKKNMDEISDNQVKKTLAKSNSFFNWMQEYSKKIISITFIIYVIINIYLLIMTIYVFQTTKEFQSLDTLITEINQTFREVIGGYIIKAAVENVSKYSGAIIDKWLELKLERNFNQRETEDSIIEEKEGLSWKRAKSFQIYQNGTL